METLHELNFEVLEHPPYSLDLASSDFHLFGLLKDALRGRHFASDRQAKEAMRVWLIIQPKTLFFSEAIQKLVNRWTKCVEKEGTMWKNDAFVYPQL